ncbi:N-acetylmuramoyl-L-alanine amidase [Spartinivicinus ruber]|uniref:N-acetylmuramoyl-L-alanine amidase n=1 Tax=Spartinivicinus ruber TaxID=2683272 RepID=UPI0013D65942|nr:N-acetylmuramoyl-L-alanine amidase [Spartinivicinus ruber]
MKITKLVVHCSDTPDDRDVTAADIHLWHVQRSWSGIGYHKVIRRDGVIENGRPEFWPGAHVKGHNRNSLGVCLVGRDEFTPDQLDSLERVLTRWKDQHPLAEICGHTDLDPKKTCPNFDVGEWWEKQ